MAKNKTEPTHETSGETQAVKAKPSPNRKLSVDEIKAKLEELPEGAKEQAAWQELGEGNLSHLEFRKLWLAIRCPKKTKG